MPGIILHEQKAVYWPLPKNACTTFKIKCGQLLGLDTGNDPHNAPFETTGHIIEGYKNFGLVRHPLARLYSCWLNKLAPGHPVAEDFVDGIDPYVFRLWPDLFWGEMPFAEFVEAVLSIDNPDPHFAPQSPQLPEGVEFCKMEDISCIISSFFPVLNASQNDDWEDAIRALGLDLILDLEKYYREDFSRFHYPNFINTILVDCDGVLTDGALTIDHTGAKMFKRFHTKDVRAIRELVYHGYEVALITADDWLGVSYFAEKVGADVLIVRDKGKIPFQDYIAVGDDAWDVSMLKNAVWGFVPADADWSVRKIDGVRRLQVAGGKGVMAEVARILLRDKR